MSDPNESAADIYKRAAKTNEQAAGLWRLNTVLIVAAALLSAVMLDSARRR